MSRFSDEFILGIIASIRKNGNSGVEIRGISSSYFYSRARILGFSRAEKKVNPKPRIGCVKHSNDLILMIRKEIRKTNQAYATIKKHGLHPSTYYWRAKRLISL